jgi:hypothetical protein
LVGGLFRYANVIRGIDLDFVCQSDGRPIDALQHSSEELEEVCFDVFPDEWTGQAQRQLALIFLEFYEGDGRKPRVELLAGDVVADHPETVVPS